MINNNTAQQAVREVYVYISRSGGAPRGWYVGIASDPRVRLFNDHNVQENGDYWIYRSLNSDTDARKVERYFINCGCKGGPGGGGTDTRYVYAYRVTSSTRQ